MAPHAGLETTTLPLTPSGQAPYFHSPVPFWKSCRSHSQGPHGDAAFSRPLNRTRCASCDSLCSSLQLKQCRDHAGPADIGSTGMREDRIRYPLMIVPHDSFLNCIGQFVSRMCAQAWPALILRQAWSTSGPTNPLGGVTCGKPDREPPMVAGGPPP